MRYLYAVETAAQLSAYEAIANRLRPRLEAYLRFLREEYAVESPPRAIVWTGREIATEVLSSVQIGRAHV